MERRGFLKALLGAPLALPLVKKLVMEPVPERPFIAPVARAAVNPPRYATTSSCSFEFGKDLTQDDIDRAYSAMARRRTM